MTENAFGRGLSISQVWLLATGARSARARPHRNDPLERGIASRGHGLRVSTSAVNAPRAAGGCAAAPAGPAVVRRRCVRRRSFTCCHECEVSVPVFFIGSQRVSQRPDGCAATSQGLADCGARRAEAARPESCTTKKKRPRAAADAAANAGQSAMPRHPMVQWCSRDACGGVCAVSLVDNTIGKKKTKEISHSRCSSALSSRISCNRATCKHRAGAATRRAATNLRNTTARPCIMSNASNGARIRRFAAHLSACIAGKTTTSWEKKPSPLSDATIDTDVFVFRKSTRVVAAFEPTERGAT